MALVTKTFGDIITFTRASTATYFDSAGVLTSAGNNVPRFDYNPATLAAQGLLIEESRTNSIRNNTMQGAVAGTPGTLPTNWSSTLQGLSQTIIGTGVEKGITYIDIRFSGTTTSAGAVGITFEPQGIISCSNGQTWAPSLWISLISGNFTGITARGFSANIFDSVGAYLGDISFGSIGTITSSFQRLTPNSNTISQIGAAFLRPYIFFSHAGIGTALDFTLRIGLPQLELGAFATSVIPTTTTALTRSADVASVNTLSPWYNATEGTLYVQAQDMSDSPHATSEPRAASINDGTTNNTINIVRVPASAQARARVVTGGTTVFNTLTTAWPLATQAKIGLAYKANDFAACLGGGAVATSASGAVPTVSALTIGNITTGGTSGWVGWIQRLTYYPRRLTNAELQAITA